MEEIAAQNKKIDFHEDTSEKYIKKPSTRPVAKCIFKSLSTFDI